MDVSPAQSACPQDVDSKSTKRIIEPDAFGSMVQRLIRACGKRVGDNDPDYLAIFDELREAIDKAEYLAIDRQLAAGFTFRQMADAVGMSPSAISNRYYRRQPAA